MAIEAATPLVNRVVPKPTEMYQHQIVHSSQAVEKKAQEQVKKVNKMTNPYATDNNQNYKSERQRIDYFNNQMYKYLDGVHDLIEAKSFNKAHNSLEEFKSDIYITDEDKIIVDFYRLVSFVSSRLAAPTVLEEANRLKNIVGNLRDGFKE